MHEQQITLAVNAYCTILYVERVVIYLFIFFFMENALVEVILCLFSRVYCRNAQLKCLFTKTYN